MRHDLKELVKLVRLDEQYTAAVAHGALQADEATSRAHQQRAIRIDELSRKYGLQ
jgi:hypothetical protein